jgi:nitrite reductase/ring-hydroxylating ferredoxin subunit
MKTFYFLIFSVFVVQGSVSKGSVSLNPFFREWQCVGIEANIDTTRPYSYNVGDLPLVAWKNKSNHRWITTLNICKHMGSRLDTGKIAKNGCSLQCPYHGLEFTDTEALGQMVEQDGKLFWAFDPIRPLPHKIPFYENKQYVHSMLQLDMDCSLLDSAYNTMDIRHPEFVHTMGFGSSMSPTKVKTFMYPSVSSVPIERIGLEFDYVSNDLMKFINGVESTHNFHMYVRPSFTWSRVSFQNKHLIVSVNLLPIGPRKTRWFVTLVHNYNTSPVGKKMLQQMAYTIVSQDYFQLRNQYPENALKRAVLFNHIFPQEEAILGLQSMLQDYRYPDIQDCANLVL